MTTQRSATRAANAMCGPASAIDQPATPRYAARRWPSTTTKSRLLSRTTSTRCSRSGVRPDQITVGPHAADATTSTTSAKKPSAANRSARALCTRPRRFDRAEAVDHLDVALDAEVAMHERAQRLARTDREDAARLEACERVQRGRPLHRVHQ